MSRITIADIARRAGVSTGAVSYAVNGRPGVSAATRDRILAVAAEMGWAPSSAARSLSVSSTDTVGLALARPAALLGSEPFFMQLIAGMETVFAERNIGLLLQVVPDLEAESRAHRRWWSARRVDAVIVVDVRVDDPRFAVLEELQLPALALGDPAQTGGQMTVWADNAEPMADAVRRLAALGHRRLAHVAGQPELGYTLTRSTAFSQTVASLGLPEPVTVHTDFTGEAGAAATRDLLGRPTPPTAIIYDNDVMAVAGLGAAAELGRRVPQDVSLVAWDDSPLCQLTHPPISSLNHDVFSYGVLVARVLTELVDGAPATVRRAPPPRLVERGSTAPPAAGNRRSVESIRTRPEPTRRGHPRVEPTE